jgi:regulator of sirC expression with transglutaminase-like and TPR domain
VTKNFELGPTRARTLLYDSLEQDPSRLDLAAIAVASLENPRVAVESVLARLDGLAARVKETPGANGTPLAQVQALRRVLVDEEGFHGNSDQYFAPENSFIDQVLDRRTGLPITLAVIYLEVARRAGIPLFGVSFPGHFVVASDQGEQKLVVDPFNHGEILTEEGCEELLKQVAPQVKFTTSMIAPAPMKSIAYRMLTNLKRVYLDQGEGEKALRVVDLMMLIAPDHPGELRARATILSALGAYRAALVDIERCLELSPEAPDHQSLQLTAEALRQRVDHLN